MYEAQMVDNGKLYYRVATGLSKADAEKLAKQHRNKGRLARLRKYKFGKYGVPYKWDVYVHGWR